MRPADVILLLPAPNAEMKRSPARAALTRFELQYGMLNISARTLSLSLSLGYVLMEAEEGICSS